MYAEPREGAPGSWVPHFVATRCANCDIDVGPRLFCGERCSQIAKLVRYARGRVRDGRAALPDVQGVIRIRAALIYGGGYPKQARRIPPEVRRAVLDRDGGRCKSCGQAGNEVDHVAGNSAEIENLQLLCHACHMEKTQRSFRPITPDDTEVIRLRNEILRRIKVNEPERLCDREDVWERLWPMLLKRAREVTGRRLGRRPRFR